VAEADQLPPKYVALSLQALHAFNGVMLGREVGLFEGSHLSLKSEVGI
jgi:hypothetical protein